MAGESVRLVDKAVVNAIVATDTLFVTANGVVAQINPPNAFSNVNLKVATLLVGNTATPANSTITVAQGTIWYDANYIYCATANNTLKRVALTAF